MQVLIVQPNADLAEIWRRHLVRGGVIARVAHTQEEAIRVLQSTPEISIVVLDLVLPGGSAFAVADYASVRHPEAKVISVTSTNFFSDGSIFRYIPNACVFIRAETPVEDLAALVEHYGERRA